MELSSTLSLISIDETRRARSQAAQLTHDRNQFDKRCKAIITMYPAADVLMTLPVRADHELFTEEKMAGYRWACILLATFSETCVGLGAALASITTEEMLAAAREILASDRMSFTTWFLSAGEKCYGFAQGSWEEFQAMLDEGKGEAALGYLMVMGGLIMIAENRDEATWGSSSAQCRRPE